MNRFEMLVDDVICCISSEPVTCPHTPNFLKRNAFLMDYPVLLDAYEGSRVVIAGLSFGDVVGAIRDAGAANPSLTVTPKEAFSRAEQTLGAFMQDVLSELLSAAVERQADVVRTARRHRFARALGLPNYAAYQSVDRILGISTSREEALAHVGNFAHTQDPPKLDHVLLVLDYCSRSGHTGNGEEVF
jgi:hypothetical protein